MTATSTATHPALRQRLPLYPSQFISAMALVSLGPLLDPMMRDLGVPLSKGGLISAGLFLGNVFGITILNMTMSRVPAKWALAGGTALLGAGLLVAGAASRNLWSLSLAFVLVGLAGAFMNATCWMWLAAHIKKDVAASALAMILFFGLGMVVTPVVLGQVIDRGATWRWILVAEGGIALAMALVLACLPLLDILGRQNVRFSHLRQVVAHDPWLLLGILGAGLMYTGTETTINVWLPKFQIDVFGASDTWASLAVTLFWVGLVVGRLTVMRLTRRFSPSRLLLLCACTLAVFVVAVAFTPSQTVALVLSVGAGLGASASYGIIGSYSGRFPEWQSGVASSLFILSGGIGSVAFPYLMGPLASSAGFRIALAATAVPAVAYALFSLVIHARADEERR
jgi:fucose permease